MSKKLNIAFTGAKGKMGLEVIKMVLDEHDFELVIAVDPGSEGQDIGAIVGRGPCGVLVTADLATALAKTEADVLVDFTIPQVVMDNVRIAIAHGVRPVIGTTGMSPADIEEIDRLLKGKQIGGLVAPNFSIGAILMMKFAAQAAKYMPHVEIIEYHGEQKLDAPSGTSIKTAELIAETRQKLNQGNPNAHETISGARGGEYEGFRIHSVRLPGVFAQQEVVFGGYGQTLKIRHASYERAGYMPGVAVAARKVMDVIGVVYGFEHFID
jgi:4-hydroxy-tetrahydrodipicolinate reductase